MSPHVSATQLKNYLFMAVLLFYVLYFQPPSQIVLTRIPDMSFYMQIFWYVSTG